MRPDHFAAVNDGGPSRLPSAICAEGGSSTACRARWRFLTTGANLIGAVAAFLASGTAALGQELTIVKLGHYTENRGANEAGILASYQIVVTATVVPSGHPTLVFAEQGGVRQALWHLPMSSAPDTYVYLRRVEPGLTGSWRIVAERGDVKGTPAWTPVLAKPQEVPLVRNVRVTGSGATPRVIWEKPDLTGFDIDRIRVVIRGGKRVYERFLDGLSVSGDLPPSATAFAVPPGALTPGERYIFEVRLEDLEGGELENSSSTYTKPYTVPR